MSRTTVLSSTALVLGALALTACGTDSGAASGSATSAGAAASSPRAAVPISASKTAAKHAPADPLASLARPTFAAAMLTPTQVGAFTPKMTRSSPDSGKTSISGQGGTCPALAEFMKNSGLLGSVKANKVEVSYDNTAAAKTPADIRTITQILETTPKQDAGAQLRRYRASAASCATALVDHDGSRLSIQRLPDPSGLGTDAFAMRVTVKNGPVNVATTLEATASGKNVLAIATSGFSAQERSAIMAQAWKNLSTR